MSGGWWLVVVMLVGVVGEFYTFVGATNLPLIGIGPEIEINPKQVSHHCKMEFSSQWVCVCVLHKFKGIIYHLRGMVDLFSLRDLQVLQKLA